ncbi:MAG TPA: hypothetical protein VK783_16400 [Bacteroidia bacterium]|jgi:hypothetical protein|nr:hypothetical protein [Bacteroidia bacterium]
MEAEIKYAEKQNQIKSELVMLQEKLQRHQVSYNKNTTNWGCIGDLGHILEQLKQLNQFLNV